ncbi:MAG TPA: hypothetical protein VFQ44_05260 [Streptosporangiaceae bacterium]|nr:hypothetical protein [Streptosporangiaceae bacterium]
MDRESRSRVQGDVLPPAAPAPVARLAGTALRSMLTSFMVGCGLDEQSADLAGQELVNDHHDGVPTDQLCDVLLAALPRCLDANLATIYLSVPITSGRAYLQQRSRDSAEGDSDGQAKAAALRSNLTRASIAVERLRNSEAANVINPSRLPDVPGWTQDSYHSFWSRVIAGYPQRLVFLDGWHYSVGCTREFADSVRFGLPAFTESLADLDASTAIQLVQTALDEYASAKVNDAELRTSLETIHGALAESRMRRDRDDVGA